MKKISILISCVCSLVCIASCAKQEQLDILDRVLKVDASYATSATKATAMGFEPGDTFSLWAVEYDDNDNVALLQIGGNYLNGELMTKGASGWISNRMLYWSDRPCDFYGIYPAVDINSIENFRFDVVCDQNSTIDGSTMTGYGASDLLWAKTANVSYDGTPLRLRFRHMLAKLTVKIVKGDSFEGELSDDIKVSLLGVKTTVQIDLNKGTTVKYPYSESHTIKLRKVATDTFEAVVVPQNIERATPLIEIEMDDISYILTTSLSFHDGYNSTVKVTLNISPVQEKIEIALDGDIEDWN